MKLFSSKLSLAEWIKFHSVEQANGCWDWAGALNKDGYGNTRYRGKSYVASRAAYEGFVGPIPEGLTIDHLCRNRKCVNPSHLEPVTFDENQRRRRGLVKRALVSHCKRGHEYSEANSYYHRGRRFCRACHKADKQQRYAKRQRPRVRLSGDQVIAICQSAGPTKEIARQFDISDNHVRRIRSGKTRVAA